MTPSIRPRAALAISLGLLLGAAGCAGSGAPPPGPVPPHGASAADPELPAELEAGVHYAVYRGDGTVATLDEVVAALDTVEVVFLGEEHDDRIGHRLQLHLLHEAFLNSREEARPLVLSLEMFERDVQLVVDEYMDGLITEEHFLDDARPWENYRRDYRPLVEFARAHHIPVVAANAPRRYVNRASRLGRESLEELPEEGRAHLPPLPYPGPSDAYRAEWDAIMGDAAGHLAGSPLDAQTLWDAAMAHSVARSLRRHPGGLVLHLAGGFHVENGTGIPDALDHYRPGTRWMVVAVRSAGDVGGFDPGTHGGRGAFVVLTADGG